MKEGGMLIRANGFEMFYIENGEGVPLVFVHGFPLDHTIWAPLLPYLGKHVRIIMPDLRGFGESEAPQGEYSIRQMADDLAGLLDALKIDRAAIAGHSMGGYVALAYAHYYPHRLAGLALVSSQAGSDTPENARKRMVLAERARVEGARPVVEAFVPKLTASSQLQAALTQIVLRTPISGMIGGLRAMAERSDAIGWLGDIDRPCLVISGEQDVLISRGAVEAMVRGLPNCRWVELPSAGHMPMMEAPQATAQAMQQWIQGLDQG